MAVASGSSGERVVGPTGEHEPGGDARDAGPARILPFGDHAVEDVAVRDDALQVVGRAERQGADVELAHQGCRLLHGRVRLDEFHVAGHDVRNLHDASPRAAARRHAP
jgi:hypothetical protein